MAVEKSGIEAIFDKIKKTFTGVFDKIKETFDGFFKKEEEGTAEDLSETEENIWGSLTKKELGELMEEIKDDGILSKEEEEAVEEIKDTEIKGYFNRIEKIFSSEEIKEREKEEALSELEKATNGDKNKDEEKIKEFKQKIKNNQKKIDEDSDLKNMIEGFVNIKNPKKASTIDEIIVAYDLVKAEKEEANNTDKITDTDVMEKIK